MYDYKATLVRIIDGDSIVLNIDLGFHMTITNRHIRLMGLDTPEIRTRDPEEKVRGFLAKYFVEKMFADAEKSGAEITVVSHGIDKFGRVLGEIIFTTKDTAINLNEELLKSGHAVVYP